MSTQLASPQANRISALIVVGVALVASGIYANLALLSSVFARYMYVEDLNLDLDENTIFLLTRITDADRGILVLGIILVVLGAACLVSAVIRRRSRFRRRG